MKTIIKAKEFHRYPELELVKKLTQLENSFKFLEYMNNGKTATGDEFPRNTTERSTVTRGLSRAKECLELFKSMQQ
tara:strand:- start:388 stop:615 length:228 start_codon:yes stop_codon:yes gene_type:complete